MSLTIGLTAMDPATEAALKSAFAGANARLQHRWQLLPDAEAEHVIIDMDSMYGPMGWLRLHAAGKQVVGLTSAARAQTDFRLGRPFDEDSVAALLREIADRAGVDLSVETAAPAPAGSPAPEPQAADAPADAIEAPASTGNDAHAVAEPAQEDAPPHEDLPAAAPVAEEAPDASPVADAPATPDAGEAVEPAITPEPPQAPAPAPEPPRERGLADWLAPRALAGRVRYSRDSGPTLLIDADARRYHGPATLKPLMPYFEGAVERDALEPVDADAWARDSAIAGAAQPLSRLVWAGALASGKGRLLPGFDPAGRYRLVKWPQTEREFPRHFRISTAMMKGPATLPEIAAASGVPVEDVTDFVNANLATGFAEFVPEPPPEPAEPPRPTGLFGRLRGK